jgi:hypothetical protein
MFGISLAKIAVLMGIIGAIIAGFRYAARIKAFQERQARARAETEAKAARQAAARARPAPAAPQRAIEEMRPCPRCGTYMPAGNATCGRRECAAS